MSSRDWSISNYPSFSVHPINKTSDGLDLHLDDVRVDDRSDFTIRFSNGINVANAHIIRRPNLNTKYICVEAADIYWGSMVTIRAKIWFNKCGGKKFYVDAPFSDTDRYFVCQPGYSQYRNPNDGLAYAKSDTFCIPTDEEKAYLVSMRIPRAAIMSYDQKANTYWVRFNIFVMDADDPNYMGRVKYTLDFKNKDGDYGEINDWSGEAEPVENINYDKVNNRLLSGVAEPMNDPKNEESKISSQTKGIMDNHVSKRVYSDSNAVYDIADQMPSFPGGRYALFEFLKKNKKMPEKAKKTRLWWKGCS